MSALPKGSSATSSSRFPAPPAPMPPTPKDELDRMVARLQENKGAWGKTPVEARVELLEAIKRDVGTIARDWGRLGSTAKGFRTRDPAWGEEYLVGPLPLMLNIDSLLTTLKDIRDHGQPRIPKSSISQRADGRVVVQVYPRALRDHVLLTGVTAEVWQHDDVEPHTLMQNVAKIYRERSSETKVSLVLGAGNQSSIPPMDALYKLFVENEVVLLKMNPVNEYLGPLFRRAFQVMVDRGFFEVCYGGVEEGSYLTSHPGIETLHVTGSERTYDAIVWGPPEGREERKRRGERVNERPFSSELGNITPVIVVPAEFTQKELEYQASRVVSQITNNASFNCVAAKLIVTSADWPQREAFLAEVERGLRAAAPRKAYYPGAIQRFERLVAAHESVRILGQTGEGIVPWTLIRDLDPTSDALAFRMEPFCGVTSEVVLSGATPADFLPRAVEFVNERVWGTLGASVIVHDSVRAHPAHEAAFQEALDGLRYGSIGINIWPGIGFAISDTTWGAHPGHTPEDIGSGQGVVHNAFMFDRPLKSVVFGPFIPLLKPYWFEEHRTKNSFGQKATDVLVRGDFLALPRLALDALRG